MIKKTIGVGLKILMLICFLFLKNKSYEEATLVRKIKIRGDHTATVISYIIGPLNKGILVNGREMTAGVSQV